MLCGEGSVRVGGSLTLLCYMTDKLFYITLYESLILSLIYTWRMFVKPLF